MLKIFNYFVHNFTVALQYVSLQRVLQALMPSLPGKSTSATQFMPYCTLQVHPSFVATRKNQQILRNAIFYNHELMKENFHFKLRLLRQHPCQRKLDDIIIKNLLNVACNNDIVNLELPFAERKARHVTNVLFFLAVQHHSDGREQDFTYSCIP